MSETKADSHSGRRFVLDAASNAVLQDRNAQYGNPEDNFKDIADVWNWWFNKRRPNTISKGPDLYITPMDVAFMMQLMKLARSKVNPNHLDSIIDVAGYAACAGDFARPPQPAQPQPAPTPDYIGGQTILPLADGEKIDRSKSAVRT